MVLHSAEWAAGELEQQLFKTLEIFGFYWFLWCCVFLGVDVCWFLLFFILLLSFTFHLFQTSASPCFGYPKGVFSFGFLLWGLAGAKPGQSAHPTTGMKAPKRHPIKSLQKTPTPKHLKKKQIKSLYPHKTPFKKKTLQILNTPPAPERKKNSWRSRLLATSKSSSPALPRRETLRLFSFRRSVSVFFFVWSVSYIYVFVFCFICFGGGLCYSILFFLFGVLLQRFLVFVLGLFWCSSVFLEGQSPFFVPRTSLGTKQCHINSA